MNNDGFMDLFVSKGSITGQADFAVEDPSNLLIGQPTGPFVEGALDAGILTFDFGRGAALVDFNLDGRLDLIESFYGTPARVWRNLPPAEDRGAERPLARARHRADRPERRRDRRGGRGPRRCGRVATRADGRRRARRRAARLGPRRARERDERGGSSSLAGRRGRAVAAGRRRWLRHRPPRRAGDRAVDAAELGRHGEPGGDDEPADAELEGAGTDAGSAP